MATIQIRAAEPRDVEAIAEISNCPGVIAGTLQLPFRSIEERREGPAQRSPPGQTVGGGVGGGGGGVAGLSGGGNPPRRPCGGVGRGVPDGASGGGGGGA